MQDDPPAEELTVSPPLALLINPQADMRRFTFEFLQPGHAGLSFPMTIASNFLSHLSQKYS